VENKIYRYRALATDTLSEVVSIGSTVDPPGVLRVDKPLNVFGRDFKPSRILRASEPPLLLAAGDM
jgi:hypothetical protein